MKVTVQTKDNMTYDQKNVCECKVSTTGNSKVITIRYDESHIAYYKVKEIYLLTVEEEDMVSRKAVFEAIDDCNSDGLTGIFCSYDDGERFKKYINKKLPPNVTPKEEKK